VQILMGNAVNREIEVPSEMVTKSNIEQIDAVF